MGKKLQVFLFLLLLTSGMVQAQRTVEGVVFDDTDQALIGAVVTVKGTTKGTVTDIDGKFSLQLTDAAEALLVSYVGFVPKEVLVGNQRFFEIRLQTDDLFLDEFIVTGYSSQKKKDVTGAVSSIDMEELSNIPAPGVDAMIQGRAAGVSVVSDNAPGGGVAVRIRGFGTIRNNDPLYVIDGVPTTSGINMINPNDIATFQVLKDASAASIYGSRAANGVVIITTKKGRSEQTRLNFNSYAGIQTAFNLPEMLNARQYGELLWEATRNDGGQPSSDVYWSGSEPVIPTWLDAAQNIPSADVDWVAEIFRPAFIQSHNLDFSKNTSDANHFVSFNYFEQEGLIKHTGFKRVSARFNTEYKVLDRLTFGENLTAAYTWNTDVTTNAALGSVVYDAYRFPSISPVYDVNGDFAGSATSDTQNPLGRLYRNKDNVRKNLKLFGNVYGILALTEGLEVKSNLGINFENYNYRRFNPSFQETYTQRVLSDLSTNNRYQYEWVWSNTVNYSRTFNDHQLGLLAGVEAISFYQEGFSASRFGFPYDDPNFRYLDAGDGSDQRNAGTASDWSLFSYLTKLDYSYLDRYLASVTLRRDGSSKLANNRWGTFPAVSAGWRVSAEEFFDLPAVDDLKLRVGWGETGNQDIPPYSTFSSYRSYPNYSNYPLSGSQNSVVLGLTETRNGNPDLKWETTTQTNLGLDATLFNHRLGVNVDYFVKTTRDMLIERPLTPMLGGSNISSWDNAGEMRNKGLELNLQYFGKERRDFNYSVGLNLSSIRNELISLPEEVDYIALPSSLLHTVNFGQEVTRSAVGQPIASFYGFEALGLFSSQEEIAAHATQPDAQPGDIKFRDTNGDGIIDSKDRTFIGNPHPDLTVGLNLSATFRQFDAALFFYGSFGNETYDLTRYYLDFFNLSAYNKHLRVSEAWNPENPDATVPRLSLNDGNNNIRPSSYFLSDGSFLRLRNMQVGYSLPEALAGKLSLSKLRIYVQAQNVFTITSYKGLDPEIGLQNYDSELRNLDIGVDRGIYPPNRNFTLGVNLTL
ncbi:SusC/RagA family TonB-linked outer membrane protein [Cyclobacterium xiamenense]|uniref:SusC/RagA family TonB-linked outer membrane protein n=1 Tax=Cyclobacterium xiamenense TaxID=1297121 RepID=UPI0019D5FA56|nr:TonB-dependent receptor [Cyclobacterium xiamenense]